MAPRHATATRDDCLSDDEMTSLLRGAALSSEHERWMVHLDSCRACRTVLSESAQHLATSMDGAGDRRRERWRSLAVVGLIGFLLALVALLLLRAAYG